MQFLFALFNVLKINVVGAAYGVKRVGEIIAEGNISVKSLNKASDSFLVKAVAVYEGLGRREIVKVDIGDTKGYEQR